MHSLIWAFAVCIWPKTHFRMARLKLLSWPLTMVNNTFSGVVTLTQLFLFPSEGELITDLMGRKANGKSQPLSPLYTPTENITSVCSRLDAKHTGLNQQTTNWWHFSYFSQKTGFDILFRLSPFSTLETICRKCEILFYWRQYAWNFKSCFLGEIVRKKYHQFVFCWISPESGKG